MHIFVPFSKQFFYCYAKFVRVKGSHYSSIYFSKNTLQLYKVYKLHNIVFKIRLPQEDVLCLCFYIEKMQMCKWKGNFLCAKFTKMNLLIT